MKSTGLRVLFFVVAAALVLGPATTEAQDAPFCVMDVSGAQCIYFDAGSCRQIAATMGGMCVANPEYMRGSGRMPPLSVPAPPPELHCTTYRVGDHVYTDCYGR